MKIPDKYNPIIIYLYLRMIGVHPLWFVAFLLIGFLLGKVL